MGGGRNRGAHFVTGYGNNLSLAMRTQAKSVLENFVVYTSEDFQMEPKG